MNNCKICKSDNINQFTDTENISYKGSMLAVAMEYSICNNCQREFVSKQQIINNDARVRDAKKGFDGLLTSSETYDARISLGLTQEQASVVFGGGKNAFSKYERAEVSQSVAMDKLIKICLKHPNVFHELVTSVGINVSHNQLRYENNIMPYSKNVAANKKHFKSVKSIELMKDVVAYG